MLMKKARCKLVDYGKRMAGAGLTEGTAGNLSIYDPINGLMAITPSGIAYEKTKLEDIVILDLEGNIIDGTRKPSSEYHLHTEIYKKKPLATAIVHTHSTYCTVLSCMGVSLDAVHYVLADACAAAVPVAEYATYGSLELAQNAAAAIGDGKAVLLANHGMLSCGENIKEAFSIAKTCEWVAKIQWTCMCAGNPVILSAEEMGRIIQKFQTYGQPPLLQKEDLQ